MPSDKAQAARERATEVMEALNNGKPDAADEVMGKPEPKAGGGIVSLSWLKSKFSGGKKDKKTADTVIR